MIKRISCILFTILLCFSFSSHPTYAAQQQNDSSFFSFLENSLLTLITKTYNQQVLAAQTEIPSISPTAIPTLFPTLFPTLQPTPTSEPSPSLSIISAYILNGVNEYRTSLGLSPVQSSDQTCAFAAIRAQEISNGFNHDGFYNRVNNHTIPYTLWAHATENIAQAPNYQEVVTLWKNSPEHAANMRDNTPYVCIEQYGSYYAYEGMRP